MHFAPPNNWMNDPNGLVHHGGRYHLYYQYNPHGTQHGSMSWGHASSPDLVAWQHHPVAMVAHGDIEFYSGSVVVDDHAVSGYGSPEHPALLAFYTLHRAEPQRQTQCVAVSLDEGLTWTQHPGNPVLDRHSSDFRDPKVLWWPGEAGGGRWVMVTVEAERREVHLFGSDDLLTWTPLSVFGPSGAVGGIWECPDLFPLTVAETGEQLWVLLVSLNPGGIAGGSGTQYFVGRFDGTTFTPLDGERIAWLDHGPDDYAGVTFFGLPQDERTLIGWMGNWDYAARLPLRQGTRGQMTVPRRLGLVLDQDDRPVLTQQPVVPRLDGEDIAEPSGWQIGHIPGVLDLTLTLAPDAPTAIRLRTRDDGTGGVTITVSHDDVALDRREVSGGVPGFAGSFVAPRVQPGSHARLRIVLGERSVEVFADQGATVVTALILPEPGAAGASITGADTVQALRWGVPAE